MRSLGLDDSYGAYVDNVPAITLASFTMMSMFGLNRSLRGAITGHLAAFEMTSSIPNRFYGNGFRRLGHDEDVTWYYDEHVEADAVHEQIAGRDLAGGLAEQHPELLADIVFGAAACLYVDGLAGPAHARELRGRAQLAASAGGGARMTGHEEQPVIVACPDGPLLVRGHIDLTTPDGTPIEQHRRTVALCRCGISTIKPFCDGSHKAVHFRTDT